MSDLEATNLLREREAKHLRNHLCDKLDSIFPRAYSLQIIAGSVGALARSSTTQVNGLLAVISLDPTFLQSAVTSINETMVSSLGLDPD